MDSRVRVLHVDDEPDFAEMAAEFLEREDRRLDVSTASDAGEALDRLEDGGFDCVVSDYDMTGKNGIELLVEIRDRNPELPFILFTGKGSEELASDAISAGVTDYLQKETGVSQYKVLANRVKNAVEQHRSRRKAEETQRKLSEIAEKTDDVLYMFTGDWSELLFVNSAYEKMWGGDIEELREDPTAFMDFVHSDDRVEVEREMARVADGEHVVTEYRVERPDGEVRHVLSDTRPVFEDGEVARIVGFVRDVTERKRSERRFERTHELRDRTERIAEVGSWEIDTDSMDVFWSDNLFEILGMDPGDEEPPLDEALDVYHEDDRGVVDEAVETALVDGESFDVEVRFRRPDDEVGWLRVQGVPTVEDDEVVTLRGAVQDVTDRKRRERELRRRTEELEQMNERLEEFASVVSHDLRNPLSVAKGRLDMAMDDVDDSEGLEAVDRSLDRMKDIIDDILWLAREGGSTGERVEVALESLARDAWSQVETEDATLVVEDGRRCFEADEDRALRLFENLFRNAVEHGGGDVSVEVGELGDGFYVEDDGGGVPEDRRDDVFEAGYSTVEEGTGFGLSIVRRIAEAHGWSVDVVEGGSGGARFEVKGVEAVDADG